MNNLLKPGDVSWIAESTTGGEPKGHHFYGPGKSDEAVYKGDLHNVVVRHRKACVTSHLFFDPVKDVHRSEEHTSELQSRENLVCRLLLEKKKIEYMIHQ